MSPREAVLLVYGLIFGTSTPYLKPKNRFLFPTTLRTIAPGLDLLLGGSGICAVLRGSRALCVVNANRGDAGRKWRDEVRSASLPIETVIVNSLNGNFADSESLKAFSDAEVYFHSADTALPAMPSELKTHNIVTETRLKIGDETIVLIPVDGAATTSDLVVFFESRSVMMFGALFYNRVHPELAVGASAKVLQWIKSLEMLMETFQPAVCVPAEGDIGTVADVREFIRYLKTLTDDRADFSYCRENFDWTEIPSTTSLEENYDTLRRNKKTHTSLN